MPGHCNTALSSQDTNGSKTSIFEDEHPWIHTSIHRSQGAQDRKAELANWLSLLKRSTALTIPVFLTAMVFPVLPGISGVMSTLVLGFPLDELVKWGLTTPIQFVIGARFHVGAYKAVRSGRCVPSPFLALDLHPAWPPRWRSPQDLKLAEGHPPIPPPPKHLDVMMTN